MTLPLPDPLLVQQSWENERTGVQRNFEALAQAFPLGANEGNFQQVPQVYANRSAALAVNNATVTAVTLPSEGYDLGTATEQHSTSANTDRLTCRVPGLYAVIGFVQWASNGAGTRNLRIDVNGGAAGVYEIDARGANGADETRHGGAVQLRLVVDDYINLAAFQTSGGNLDINVARLSWAWVSP